MPLDINKIKQRREATARGGGGSFFKCREGKNFVRVLSFKHKVTKDDVKRGYFNKKKLGKTVEELDRPVTRAFGISKSKRPVLLRTEKEVEKARKMLSKKRDQRVTPSFMLNVVDTKDVDAGVREFACPKTVYHGILGFVLDEEYGGEGLLGVEGRDFIIEFDKSQAAASMYVVRLRAEGKSEELPESLQDDAKDFYDEKVYASLGESFGRATDEGEDEDEEEPEDDEDSDESDDEEDLEDSDDEDEESESDEDDLESDDDEESEDEEEPEEEEDEEVDERPKKKAKKKAPLAKKGKAAAKKLKKRR